MKNSLSTEDVSSLLKKAQEIINVAPELSLKYVLLAEKQANNTERQELIGVFNKIMGECFLLLQNYKSAESYLIKADSLYTISDNPIQKIEIKTLLAKYYNETGNKDKAIEIYNHMIIKSTSIGYQNGIITSLYNMANLYISEANFNDAFEILKTINKDDLASLSEIFKLKLILAKSFTAIKCKANIDILSLIDESLTIAHEINDPHLLKLVYENYYHYYKTKDNIKEAFVNLEKSYTISKNITNEESHKKLSKLLTQYEIDQKEQIIDITQQRNKKLQESNATIRKQKLLLETIVDTIPNPIYYKTVEGKYLGFNRSWNDTFNSGRASKVDKNVYDISIDEDAKKFDQNDKELLYKKHLTRFETKMTLSDNQQHDLVFHKDVFRDEKGSVAGIVGVINDVTEFKNINKELEKSNDFLSTIFDVAPVGICIFNEAGKLRFANDYLRDLFMFKGFIGEASIFDFIVESEVERLKDGIDEILKSGEIADTEVRMKSTHGDIIHTNVIVKLLNAKHEDQNFYLCVINDITDRKIYDESLRRSEKKLMEVNSTKDRLFAIIAHDLRGPIGNFREIFRLLASNKRTFSDDEKKSLMKELYKSADYTFDLLENLLHWSRSQRDEVKIVPNYHSIYDLFSLTEKELKSLLENKEIEIVNKINHSDIGFFDKNMLSVVMRNILSNAIKFSYTKSTITVSSKKEKGIICIGFKDTGVGIDEASLAKIFDDIETYTTIGTSNERGTGLGLVLCKNFIEKNDGKLWVESEVGKGSTFFISVPVENKDNNVY